MKLFIENMNEINSEAKRNSKFRKHKIWIKKNTFFYFIHFDFLNADKWTTNCFVVSGHVRQF